MLRRRLTAVAVGSAALIIVLWCATASFAAPVYTVNVVASGTDCTDLGTTGAADHPISARRNCSFGGTGSFNALAVANTGSVGVEADTSNTPPFFAQASASYTDTVVFTSTDPAATSVFTSMNVGVDGQIAIGTLSASAALNGIQVLGFTLQSTSAQPQPVCLIGNCDPLTLLGADFSAVTGAAITLGTTVPLNVAVTFNFILTATAGTRVDWSDTFGLLPTGPVFNLPSGFTANSPTSQIVDNRFVAPTTVPAPPTSLLFAAGLGLIAAGRRLG